MLNLNESFWSSRYQNGYVGWDIGSPSPPLYQYLCQLNTKTISILVPGAGNAYEVAAAWTLGFTNIHLLDISQLPINIFLEKNPLFPVSQVFHQDFFEHQGTYDLILEQTFFCAIDPELRSAYVKKMHSLLKPKGKLVGVLFDRKFSIDGPPFGGTLSEYQALFKHYFDLEIFEPCYNSIHQRWGSELFIKLRKLDIQD